MKIYIATGLERAAEHNVVRDALIKMGHSLSYDWTVHGSVKGEGHDRLEQVAGLELAGVMDADVVIVLLPGGRGTHTELGAALAAGRPVFIHAEDEGVFEFDERTCVFYRHKNVRRCVGPIDFLTDTMLHVYLSPPIEKAVANTVLVDAGEQEKPGGVIEYKCTMVFHIASDDDGLAKDKVVLATGVISPLLSREHVDCKMQKVTTTLEPFEVTIKRDDDGKLNDDLPPC